ncbi:hypothetical protein [Rodentibacter trehalosifermentans]|uniref:Uncharacterized protein n=1 Tax=Rodentibacter trehalosifermentans TaxID=1908263 RepID=A0A1V3IYG8_9PAST|nr:hypothetical protein [Rodentibacter trehalosifermentans]OOF47327.1 hypothetical protein BKK51_00280 [Rodentibacter trehalosifermentans]OOF49044.1 hypothetical protein BKK52_04420 [Rodentibacter trehalosifermentans]OOF52855.1 hypothetical protein BKK53_03360 [Rodentibacter trehalosifermentans]
MSEQASKSFLVPLSILAVVMVLAVDLFIFSFQSQPQVLSHLGLTVLVAQLISLLVFYKGEICPGQRGRLIKVNLAFALYWIVWFVMSLLSPEPTFTNVLCLCGLSIVYFIWKQPKEEKLRNSFLLMAALVGGLGGLAGFMSLSLLPLSDFAEYNPIAPILAGVILANLSLLIAKSRLQGLIALFPFVMMILLILNAAVIFIFLILNGLESAVNSEGVFAYAIYFICHLMIAAILAIHSVKKWGLSINTLFILLFIGACLPLWMRFV